MKNQIGTEDYGNQVLAKALTRSRHNVVSHIGMILAILL